MARRVAARKAFYQCSHDFPTQSLEQFITTVQDKARVLTDMGISVADTEILDVILMNIHPAFFTIRTTLLSQSTEPTLTSAIGTLTLSPALNYDFVKTEEEDTSRLLAANAARSGRPQRKDAEPRSGGRTLDLSASWMDDKGYRWCDVNSLVYVEWLTPFRRAPAGVHGLHKVACMPLHSREGVVPGAIIPLANVRQSCMLIPAYGRCLEIASQAAWTSANVLDKCEDFYVNNWQRQLRKPSNHPGKPLRASNAPGTT
ncbi:hypothetical protein BD626DRAFT_565463 [Schizophyllum amplum]|uniref:Uncharacterized protein n=1 Tax=Schizophyllum amplum TaxID=97359 RepID=A0A550CV27_9AGAR|nr:hypothetical protein BD626DRAFT_565463 [Auriculariopsis ampla]